MARMDAKQVIRTATTVEDGKQVLKVKSEIGTATKPVALDWHRIIEECFDGESIRVVSV